MKTVDEARAHILAQIETRPSVSLGLSEALGHVLGSPVGAPNDSPGFDNSAMDGYAVRWDDVSGVLADAPVALPVVMDLPAGIAPPTALVAGQAARIMTGAQMPDGADTVVMREDTEELGDRVIIKVLPKRGRRSHVRLAGTYFQAGDDLLVEGTTLNAGAVGLLASLGCSHAAVIKRPVVAIIATGDELVALGKPLEAGQIYNSSSYMVEGLVRAAGGVPLRMAVARDTAEACRGRFEEALASADMIVSLGGVSVGDYDVVRDVMEALGAEMGFWRIKMKPGKPLAFGTIEGKPLFGLPGNPVSTFVCFHQFVRPAIQKASGLDFLRPQWLSARLTQAVRSPPARADYQRGVLETRGGARWFRPYSDQSSGNVLGLVTANAFGIVPEGVGQLGAGDTISVEPIP